MLQYQNDNALARKDGVFVTGFAIGFRGIDVPGAGGDVDVSRYSAMYRKTTSAVSIACLCASSLFGSAVDANQWLRRHGWRTASTENLVLPR